MRTIDADAHVVEGIPFAAEALARWPDRVQVRQAEDGTPYFAIEGRRYPEQRGPGAGCPPQHGLTRAAGDPHTPGGVLADADREGIDQMVLFPSLGLGVGSIEDGAFAAEFARLYNRFVAEFCAGGEGRLFAPAALPLQNVGAAIEIAHEAKRLGLVGAVIPPALRDVNLDHPSLDAFYAAAADLDLPLGVHGAPGVHLPQIGVDRFTNYVQVHCVSFPFDQMAAMTALISGGVFERHPRLRVAFLEAGVGWVPYFLDRLHEHWEKRGDWIAGGWRRDPREYVARGNVWASCEAGETLLPAAVAALGADFILYASDYPHWDSEFPASAKQLRERADLGAEAKAKILGGNAQRFFGLA
ncbi:MAG: amidohydrolase [Proteobacteria bacterium]|nr:MAG: amidohydrolase [Pseudomonadota bacterium]